MLKYDLYTCSRLSNTDLPWTTPTPAKLEQSKETWTKDPPPCHSDCAGQQDIHSTREAHSTRSVDSETGSKQTFQNWDKFQSIFHPCFAVHTWTPWHYLERSISDVLWDPQVVASISTSASTYQRAQLIRLFTTRMIKSHDALFF